MKTTKMKLRAKWNDIRNKADRLLHWVNKPSEDGKELALQYLTVLGTFLTGLAIVVLLVSVLP